MYGDHTHQNTPNSFPETELVITWSIYVRTYPVSFQSFMTLFPCACWDILKDGPIKQAGMCVGTECFFSILGLKMP